MFDRLAELREKRENGEGGFTLIELLVVVVIIGILIAIAVPLYLNYRKGANDKASQSDLRGAVSQLEQCNSDTGGGTYPDKAASPATGYATTCAAPKLSDGTTFTYAVSSNSTAYMAWTSNSNGNKTYCYSSAVGGGVKEKTSASTVGTYTTTSGSVGAC